MHENAEDKDTYTRAPLHTRTHGHTHQTQWRRTLIRVCIVNRHSIETRPLSTSLINTATRMGSNETNARTSNKHILQSATVYNNIPILRPDRDIVQHSFEAPINHCGKWWYHDKQVLNDNIGLPHLPRIVRDWPASYVWRCSHVMSYVGAVMSCRMTVQSCHVVWRCSHVVSYVGAVMSCRMTVLLCHVVWRCSHVMSYVGAVMSCRMTVQSCHVVWRCSHVVSYDGAVVSCRMSVQSCHVVCRCSHVMSYDGAVMSCRMSVQSCHVVWRWSHVMSYDGAVMSCRMTVQSCHVVWRCSHVMSYDGAVMSCRMMVHVPGSQPEKFIKLISLITHVPATSVIRSLFDFCWAI